MALKLLFCLLLCLVLGSVRADVSMQLSRLSPEETVLATQLYYESKLEAFTNLTGIDVGTVEETTLKTALHQATLDHIHHRSFFAKVANLITFYNAISVAAVLVLVALIFLLARDLILFILASCSLIVIKILLSGNVIRYGGTFLAIFLMVFPESPIPQLNWLFFLDEYTPLVGQLILIGVSHYIAPKTFAHALVVNIIIGCLNTVYHGHWALGVLTVLLMYVRVGFFAVGLFGVYIIGFDNRTSMYRCLFLSAILVPAFICLRLYLPVEYLFLQGFETGIIFWGGFIGHLALLIVTDYDFMIRYRRYEQEKLVWIVAQFVVIGVYFGSILVGSQLEYACLKSFGGTFLVFWALDLQRIATLHIGGRNLRILLFLMLINLCGLRYLILNYPEYFLLG